jgi:glycosyltransferase involved in cell wall biosynthesis
MNCDSVSVVIPTYNAASLVTQAIDSVLGQTRPPSQVIVVDDGSIDDTQERVERYGPAVQYLRQSNAGVAAARNAGVRATSGRTIAFLDADDIWHPRKLEIHLRALEQQPDVALCGTDTFQWPCPAAPEIESASAPLARIQWRTLVLQNLFTTSTVIVQREVFERTGGFDTDLRGPEDRDLWWRVAEIATVARLPLKLTGYRRTLGSLGNQAAAMEAGGYLRLRKMDARGAWNGHRLLRRKAYSLHLYACRNMHAVSGDHARGLGCLLKSFAWYPLPYRRTEVKIPLARIRSAAVSAARVLRAQHKHVPPATGALPPARGDSGTNVLSPPESLSAKLNETLRVTHVVLSLDVGGLERGVLNQLREGRKLGQQVSVLCLERPGELAPQAEAIGARVVCLYKRPGLRPGMFRSISSTVRELAPDVLHTHHIAALFYAGPAARRLGVPLVVHTEHGRKNYAGRFRTRLLGRLAARYAQRFFCLTEDMAAAIVRHRIAARDRIRVIFNGIDTACYARRADSARVRQQLGIPINAPVIGTIGRLNEIKRQDVLLGAFARLRKRFPEAHLLLVGDGPLRSELEALSLKLGLVGSIHFAGYQPHTTAYLQAMDIFALTSRSEGMPQAALEACAAGVPVVATRVGGLPELIESGKSGILVTPGDEPAVSEAIERLLADRTLAQELAGRAHRRVMELFDVRQMAEDYHRQFISLLDMSKLRERGRNSEQLVVGA